MSYSDNHFHDVRGPIKLIDTDKLWVDLAFRIGTVQHHIGFLPEWS
jgi:hypothetical protein